MGFFLAKQDLIALDLYVQGVLLSLYWWENLVLHENCLLGKKDIFGSKMLTLDEIVLEVGGGLGAITGPLEAPGTGMIMTPPSPHGCNSK